MMFYKAPLSATQIGSPPPIPYIGFKTGETMWVFNNGLPDITSEHITLHIVKVGKRGLGFTRAFYDSSSNTLYHTICWGEEKCWVKRNNVFVPAISRIVQSGRR